jgi:hypothetical protein
VEQQTSVVLTDLPVMVQIVGWVVVRLSQVAQVRLDESVQDRERVARGEGRRGDGGRCCDLGWIREMSCACRALHQSFFEHFPLAAQVVRSIGCALYGT